MSSHSHNGRACNSDHSHQHGNSAHGHSAIDVNPPAQKQSNCLNNQKPRFYSNLIVIWGIGSGAYLDITYFSYSIENSYDRAYESLFMLVIFLWASLTYLKASHTQSRQTNIQEFESENDTESYQRPIVNINLKRFDKFCDICKQKKFERSSHCRMCGFCVLRRDHHCPALGICVGYQNNQNFINLLCIMIVSSISYLYITQLSSYTYLTNLYNFYNNRKVIREKFPELLSINFGIKVWMIFDTIFVLICFLGASVLVVQQIFYIYNDLPYYDITKNPDSFELHWGLCVMKNENKQVSINYKAYDKYSITHIIRDVWPTSTILSDQQFFTFFSRFQNIMRVMTYLKIKKCFHT